MDGIIKRLFKNTDMNDETERKEAYGKFSGIVGIIANIFLFVGKFAAGTIFNSVAVVADGFNNLSDAGSSFISFISFKLSGKPADKEHPYGHARIEYITSMAVSFIVLMVGIELFKSSVDKIIHPEESVFSGVMLAVLGASVLVKIGLYTMNRILGKKVKSIMLLATAADSLSDTLATGAVAVSIIIGKIAGVNLDGYMGVIVACFILFTGYKVLRSTMNNIIGMAPEHELVSDINHFIMSYPGVLGVHDLIVHSYGTGCCFASAHVEVSGDEDVFESHDKIDNIEKDILQKMKVHLVIHMDPIEVNDETVNNMRKIVRDDVKTLGTELGSNFEIHDFRMVTGTTHTNLIFDVVVPFECKNTNAQIEKLVKNRIHSINDNYFAVINIDRQ